MLDADADVVVGGGCSTWLLQCLYLLQYIYLLASHNVLYYRADHIIERITFPHPTTSN